MCEAHWRLPGAAEEELAPDLGRVEIQAQEGGRREVGGRLRILRMHTGLVWKPSALPDMARVEMEAVRLVLPSISQTGKKSSC